MKMKSIFAIGIALSCLSVHGQSASVEMKDYFSAHLQGASASYEVSNNLRWSEVEVVRTQVWQAWCEANQDFEEDKLPLLRPLNTDTLLWPLPQDLEPNAVMPYYYGTKGAKPSEGWPLYLYIHGSGPKTHEWGTG